MTINETIQKAIKGGYGIKKCPALKDPLLQKAGECVIFLDPDFWRCLAKAMGWEEEQDRKLFYCRTYRHPERDGDTSGGWIPESLYHRHRFIDHLAEEGTPESFFKEL